MSCREPISWLLLERRALGELDDDERARVDAHLASCDACAACAARIDEDAAAPLPPLRPKPREARVVRLPWAAIGAGLALAAGVTLWMRAQNPPGDGARVKGDAVVLSLQSSDVALEEAGVFKDGDVVKAMITCPPSLVAEWDLVVVDSTGLSFPLAPTKLRCENAAPFPGAIKLTGFEAQKVCVVWSESGPVDRGRLRAEGLAAAPHSTCRTLAPAAP